MKRTIDILLSGLALLLLSPLFLLIAVLIHLDSPGAAFYRQRRAGKNDEEFVMYKFRTMHVGTPELATDRLHNAERYITKVGNFLRKSSIDELPQLVNVFIGEMSLVGPRPALHNQVELRERRKQMGISNLRPGLTGWAQINGRDELSLEEKLAFDLAYMQKQSLLFDTRILWQTFYKVIGAHGVRGY